MDVKPVTEDLWLDFEKLFGPRGACAGCWCMFWRMRRSEFSELAGETTKQMMKGIIASGEVPGLLGYVDGEPAAWISVGPRQVFSALERSRNFKKIDEQPVWSIVCFFVTKKYRNQGLTVQLIRSAVQYAESQGASIVEAYPVEPNKRYPDVFAYMGTFSAFSQAGFKEVARRSQTRPMMRWESNKPK
jgi:GNAT superfamily N-acetyltransferase